MALTRSNRTAFNPMQSLVLIYRDCISDPQLSDEVRSRYIFAFGEFLSGPLSIFLEPRRWLSP